MRITKIALIPIDPGTIALRPVGRGRNLLEFTLKLFLALILTVLLVLTATAWAAVDAPEQRQTVSIVSGPAPSLEGQAGSAVAQDVPEAYADRIFRLYMLPGTAVLVLIIAIMLVTIFFPKLKTE